MLRRSPLKAKRDRPRRNEGRVVALRMKPKAKVAPTAEDKRFLDLVAVMGCLACGAPAIVHHIMKAPGKVRRRDNRFVAPLCPLHHNGGKESVHGLGSESLFSARWGVDLLKWAIAAWDNRNNPEAPFWRHGVTR